MIRMYFQNGFTGFKQCLESMGHANFLLLFFFLFTQHLFVPGVFFPFSVLMGP